MLSISIFGISATDRIQIVTVVPYELARPGEHVPL